MPLTDNAADDVHRHLSAAILSLADWSATAEPDQIAEITTIARLFTAAQQKLSALSFRQKSLPVR